MQPLFPTPIILPGTTTLLGLTALTSGLYSLSAPLTVIKGFGLTPPPSPSSPHASTFQTSLIHAYAVRNIGSGLSTLGLTLAWYLQREAADREVVKRCLGVVFVSGSVVAFGDAWLVGKFAGGEVDEEAGELGRKQAWGHAWAGAIIVVVGGSLLLW